MLVALLYFSLIALGLGLGLLFRSRKLKDPVDFGEYGILVRDPRTDQLRPLDANDYREMNQVVRQESDEFWLLATAKAFRQYGEPVLYKH